MQEQLFPELDKTRYGENLRRKKLILPTPLAEHVKNKQITDVPAFYAAYEIFCRWADLEKSGKLSSQMESNLESEFLTQIFGQALGYALFSENAEKWEIKPKFEVNGGQADAAIGLFSVSSRQPRAVIELKGPKVNIDRDKFNGRTPVQQCWDYLSFLPECPWGIVCNFVSFRLYHRAHTPRVFELFTLQSLKNIETFRQFYVLFQRDGLLPTLLYPQPRADRLLEESINREREVGDELYNYYHTNRKRLIEHLRQHPYSKTLEQAIRIAQKLLDRVIFIAFCEDRALLPAHSIKRAWEETPPFARVVNPRWQNFLNLFHSIDKGNKAAGISAFNGGLFHADPDVDNLELDDELTTVFWEIGRYDFRDEVNVDVLGHLFEQSVHDIERIKTGGLFGEQETDETKNKMSKSAERKRFGIYYTPPEFTEFIAYNTIDRTAGEKFEAVAKQMGITIADAESAQNDSKAAQFWLACFEQLKTIKVVDPACGSGAFLIQAYGILENLYLSVLEHLAHQGRDTVELQGQVANLILSENIHGADLSMEAVEISQLALWIRSADQGKTLADLSKNIVCGNSLVDDPKIDPAAMDWKKTFPKVFERPQAGFDCVIGNPPWERMKLQEREFFDGRDNAIASAVSAARRNSLIEKLEKKNPELYRLYQQAIVGADNNLSYIRNSGRYPLTGKGDINTYAVFAELAHTLVNPRGRVGLLVPSGIATDNTTKDFFASLVDNQSLAGLYDFENKKPVFTDVHRSFKFSILLFGGEEIKNEKFDFVFFAREVEELAEKNRHIRLTAKDIRLLNPNTRTCPIFRGNKDAELTKAIYRRVPVLIDKSRKKDGNPWGVKFFTMFHQTNDAELFHTAEQLKELKYKQDGPVWKKGKSVFLPLYEAKMIQMYDHRAAGVVINEENWFRQGQTNGANLVQHQNPEYITEPRWWADIEKIKITLKDYKYPALLAFKNVTSPTNQRTMIAAFIPYVGVINSAPLILFDEKIDTKQQCCFLGNLNSYAYDYVMRQKIGNVNLNFFLIEQIPTFPPDFYGDKCPWSKKQALEKWISERVLKLTCTSNDMIPLAEATGFEPKVHKWKDNDRAQLMAELDAAYFILYGIERDDVLYILSTFQGLAKEGQSLFDNETVKLILSCYDEYKTGKGT
jgi:hypothetical protein